MALVGAAIANEGAIMQPYLVDGIYNANGERSFSPIPVKLKQAMDADTAAAEIDIMKGVVTEGTGGKAALDDVAVAGKTGTHERGDGSDDSWFVGMAPAADPKVVVAVVIEKGESGAGASAAHDRSGNGSRSDGGAVVQWQDSPEFAYLNRKRTRTWNFKEYQGDRTGNQ